MWVHNQQQKYSDRSRSYQENENKTTNSTNCFHNFDQLNHICNKPVEDLKRTLKQIPNASDFRKDLVKLIATAGNLLVIFDATFDNSTEFHECKEHPYSYNEDVHIENTYPKEGNSLTKFKTISTSTTTLPIKLDKSSMTKKLDKCCMTDNFGKHFNVPYEGRYQNSIFHKQFTTHEIQTTHPTIPHLRTAFETRLAEVSSTLKNLGVTEWKTKGTTFTPTTTPTRLSAGEDNENIKSYASEEDEDPEKGDQLEIRNFKPTCSCRSHAKKRPKKSFRIPNPPNTPLESIFKTTDAIVPIRAHDGRLVQLEEVVTPSIIRDKISKSPTLDFQAGPSETLLQTTNMLPGESEIHTAEESTGSLVSKVTRTSKQFFKK